MPGPATAIQSQVWVHSWRQMCSKHLLLTRAPESAFGSRMSSQLCFSHVVQDEWALALADLALRWEGDHEMLVDRMSHTCESHTRVTVLQSAGGLSQVSLCTHTSRPGRHAQLWHRTEDPSLLLEFVTSPAHFSL